MIAMNNYVEPIIFFTCAAMYSYITADSEFIYQFVSEYRNFTSQQSVTYCSEGDDPSLLSHEAQIIARDVSSWTKLAITLRAVANTISVLVLTSRCEKGGRRNTLLFPVIGMFLSSILLIVNACFRISLFLNVAASVVYGASGGMTTLLNVGTLYLGDHVDHSKRAMRYTMLEIFGGIGGGLAEVGTGYWISNSGFLPTYLFIACSTAVAFILTMFLKENRNTGNAIPVTERLLKNGPSANKDQSIKNKIDLSSILTQLREVFRIYTTRKVKCGECDPCGTDCVHVHTKVKNRVWRMWFLLLTHVLYMAAVDGYELFITMFLVSFPLCFTPDFVGIRAGLDSAVMVISPFVVIFYRSLLHLSNQSILVFSVTGRIISCMGMFVAKGPALVFVATSLGAFTNLTTPFIRLQISNLVSTTEQGPALALLPSISELVNISLPAFVLTVYPATLHIRYSFIWIVMAAFFFVAFILVTVIWIANKFELRRYADRNPTEREE